MGQYEKDQRGKANGSITVFLTLIFGVIIAVVTAAFENVRFLTADSYMRAAAEVAAMSVFSEYNLELYQEYGLFAYGGYDGWGVGTLSEEFLDTISKNLVSEPEDLNVRNIIGLADSGGNYTSLYRIQNIADEISEVESLTDPEIFYQQIEEFLKNQFISNIADRLMDTYQTISGTCQGESLQQDLDTTSKYEHGDYEISQETNDSEKGENAKNEEKTAASVPSDQAGGNPLETFRKLLRDGVLNLVCDVDQLSEETVYPVYTNQEKEDKISIGDSATDLLKNLLKDRDTILDSSLYETTKKKSELLCYAQQVFSCYTDTKEKSYDFGIEYLISGAGQERDNLQGVISKLLLLRTVLNYTYVQSDASFQAESLATATEIAGAIGIPPLITAIQQTILLILAVEESCVDITALLEGKSVPIFKDATNFQMTYPEICKVSKKVFRTKAKKYVKAEETWISGSLNYQQYLWIFLSMVSEQTLRLRTFDLIQNDLQKRFNPTFSLEQCISGMQYQINYEMSFVWNGFLPKGQTAGMIRKGISGQYHYQ